MNESTHPSAPDPAPAAPRRQADRYGRWFGTWAYAIVVIASAAAVLI